MMGMSGSSGGSRPVRPGDLVRTRAGAFPRELPWIGKVLAVSSDGESLAVVDLLRSEMLEVSGGYPAGCHIVRGVRADEVHVTRRGKR